MTDYTCIKLSVLVENLSLMSVRNFPRSLSWWSWYLTSSELTEGQLPGFCCIKFVYFGEHFHVSQQVKDVVLYWWTVRNFPCSLSWWTRYLTSSEPTEAQLPGFCCIKFVYFGEHFHVSQQVKDVVLYWWTVRNFPCSLSWWTRYLTSAELTEGYLPGFCCIRFVYFGECSHVSQQVKDVVLYWWAVRNFPHSLSWWTRYLTSAELTEGYLPGFCCIKFVYFGE